MVWTESDEEPYLEECITGGRYTGGGAWMDPITVTESWRLSELRWFDLRYG